MNNFSHRLKNETAVFIEDDGNSVDQGKYELYKMHFHQLSADCRKILSLFLKKVSLREISKIMNLKSVDYAKTRKYLCKEALKKRIMNDPDCKKYFDDEN
ncbi:MAG: hypothetical protein ACT6FF_02650 [Methanosarcinaceae archaeon]